MEVASQLPRTVAVPFLVDALADQDTAVRQAALNQLRILKEKRAVQAILAQLDDTDISTQQMAMAALRSITGQQFYARLTDPDTKRWEAIHQWKAWYQTARLHYPEQLTPTAQHPVQAIDAPNLHLRTLEGQQIALRCPPKPILINFWGTWCGACQQKLPYLIAFHHRYGNAVMVIGVAFDEPEGEEGLRAFCAQRGIHYPQVMGTASVTEALGVHSVPQTVLIDTRGKIRFWWEGARDLATMERALRLLTEQRR